MSLEAAAVTIRGLLFADVFADLLQLKAHCGHRVSTGPEVLAREIPLFATQAGHRYGALPFQNPITEATGYFGGIAMHMCTWSAAGVLNDLALLLPRQCVKYFSQLASCLAKQQLAPPAWAQTQHDTYSPNWNALTFDTFPT